jgi:signal transduction histidine kinase
VTDGCGGIPDEARERVFDLGYRGTSARTPESPVQDVHSSRAGLGLAIVKGIVEAHRGMVEVANVATDGGPDTGCRFVVRLPVAEPAAG